MTTPAIEMTGISKRFGDVLANDSIDLKVSPGTIHALVGENGAGKTTLMNILYGLYQCDSGKILIRGKEQIINSPRGAISLGIGMVHQHFMLVDTLTVFENIILGDEDVSFGSILNLNSAKIKLNDLIKTFSLNIDLYSKIENLPVGIQQKIEILKVLYRRSEIIVFDEPTAVLTPQETEELFKLLRKLKSEGKTIILITHKLREVLDISDAVTVLRHGKNAGEKVTSQTNRMELAEMIVGGHIPAVEEKQKPGEKKVILSVKNLVVRSDRNINAVKDVSFEICSAEIFGLAGVEGNGQTELVEALNGLRKIKNGEIRIDINSSSLPPHIDESLPASSGRSQGGETSISHIPADRHKHGIVSQFNLYENILLGRQNETQFTSALLIKEDALKRYAGALVEKYDIRPVDIKQQIGRLSGGNQQKLVVSRELTKNSNLIIASHPTRGLDIKASAFVRNAIIEERNKGKAVFLVSSDLVELLNISDKIGVMYEGKISAILKPSETSEREIGLYMTGAKTEQSDSD